MSKSAIKRYRRNLLCTFASLLGVSSLAACADLRDEFSDSLCQDGSVSLVRGLNPVEAVDYVALQRGYNGDVAPTVEQSEGACPATADCAELEVPVENGMRQGGFDGSFVHIAYVRNDTVEKLLTVDEVRAFLGTIDTPSEAALVAYLSGYNLDCEGPNYEKVDGGYLIYGESGSTCGDDVSGHKLQVKADGSIEVLTTEIVERGDDNCAIGRLPAGLASDCHAPAKTTGQHDGVGAFFAEVAHLEAASVAAFEHLAVELEHHGAPAALIARAKQAAREETRHAILTGALARHHGAQRRIPQIAPHAVRSIEAIAVENAVEGLGRETYGALVAHHQALHAADPLIRETMQTIALDETSHAELSYELHAWLSTRLSSAAQTRVQDARNGALARFRKGMCREPHPEVRRAAGVPSAAEALRMFDGLFGSRVVVGDA